MKYRPFLHGLSAVAYIGAVVLFIRYMESIRHDTPDTFLDGMAFISLFVFSASVMAFLFFYQPLLLILENKKPEALNFFFKTLATCGATTLVLLTASSLQ